MRGRRLAGRALRIGGAGIDRLRFYDAAPMNGR